MRLEKSVFREILFGPLISKHVPILRQNVKNNYRWVNCTNEWKIPNIVSLQSNYYVLIEIID